MATDVALFFTGLAVGVMNAIVSGGTFVMFPILIALGLSPLAANATSYVAVLPGRVSTILGYGSFLKKLPVSYIWLIGPSFIGAIGGALLLQKTSPTWFNHALPFLIVAALILVAIQPWFKRKLLLHMDRRYKKTWITMSLMVLAVFVISLYGAYFGAGLGFALMALLGFKSDLKMHLLNAIKNIIGIIVAVVAITLLVNTGYINWRYGIVMASGNVIGGYIGARYASQVRSHNIRWAVIIFGVCVAAYFAFHDL